MSTDEQLLIASSELDFEKIKNLIADEACAGYQDSATGYGPLHKLVLAANSTERVDEALEILEYLLANGAVWMQGDASLDFLRFSGQKQRDTGMLSPSTWRNKIVRSDQNARRVCRSSVKLRRTYRVRIGQ
jgi:hypothetical protein